MTPVSVAAPGPVAAPGSSGAGAAAAGDPRARVPWRNRALALAVITAALVATLVPAGPSIMRLAKNIVTGRWDGGDLRMGLYQATIEFALDGTEIGRSGTAFG